MQIKISATSVSMLSVKGKKALLCIISLGALFFTSLNAPADNRDQSQAQGHAQSQTQKSKDFAKNIVRRENIITSIDFTYMSFRLKNTVLLSFGYKKKCLSPEEAAFDLAILINEKRHFGQERANNSLTPFAYQLMYVYRTQPSFRQSFVKFLDNTKSYQLTEKINGQNYNSVFDELLSFMAVSLNNQMVSSPSGVNHSSKRFMSSNSGEEVAAYLDALYSNKALYKNIAKPGMSDSLYPEDGLYNRDGCSSLIPLAQHFGYRFRAIEEPE